MKRQHPPVVTITVAFLIGLLAIATGPIGLAVIIMAGIPLAFVFGLEMMGHSTKTHQH